MSRWLRCLICFALICCILVNCSPLRAEATGAGLVVAPITGAATVTVSAPIAIGAALIALGIAAGTNDDFQRLVETAVSNAGDWVKDGAVELLQTVNSAGEKAYYVAGEMLDSLRSWCFDSSIVYPILSNSPDFGTVASGGTSFYHNLYEVVVGSPVHFFQYAYFDTDYVYIHSLGYGIEPGNFSLTYRGSSSNTWSLDDGSGRYYFTIGTESQKGGINSGSYSSIYDYALTLPRSGSKLTISDLLGCVDTNGFTSEYDISLGHLPSSDTTLDDKTVVTFHPYLAHVLETRQSGGSGGSGDDGNNNKWWLRLALGASAAAVYATTQQQQIENPSTDIQEITFGVQFDVTDTTEEDQKKILYVSPQTGTIPGTGTNPGTGTDPGGDSGSGGNTGTDTGGTTGGNSGWVPPSDHSLFALGDLSKFFPFCIPFDLFDFFTLLNADPVAPVFSWEIEDLSGQTYSLTIDLAEWDPVALLFRRLQLFLFICGLAAASRKFIKW